MQTSTAREATEYALQRAESPTMLTVTAGRARREADASDRRDRRLGPLDGLPVVWKDLFDVADTVTTCGSALLADSAPAPRDSALVRRLHELGMITLGKTNLSEFAFSGLGVNRHFGTPVNPVYPDRVPGGSSSGAAVAVATGIVPLAIGTDTSGSVRVPAAFTGCIGYRASFARYGYNDFQELSPTLDCVGVLARSVSDIRLLDRQLTSDSTTRSARRAVVPAGEWSEDCAPGFVSAFDSVVNRLQQHGFEVIRRPVPVLDDVQKLFDDHGTIVGAEAYSALGHLSGLESATQRRLQANADLTIEPVREAMSALRARLSAELDGGVLLCPTVRNMPPSIADLLADDSAYDAANAAVLRTTMVLSYLGCCGISLPVCGIGLLLSAPQGQDAMLLNTAERLSRVSPTGQKACTTGRYAATDGPVPSAERSAATRGR